MNDADREYMRRFVADAPPLSPAQRDLIRRIWAAALTPVKCQSKTTRRAA